MKKAILTALALTLVCTGAYADPKSDAETRYKEVKARKDAQRVARHNKPAEQAPKKTEPNFWQKEGERSGISRIGGGPNFLERLNPMPFFKSQDDQYRARKAASAKQ